MSVPFVSELRTVDEVLKVGDGEAPVLHLRVQIAELWDTMRVDAPGSAALSEVKSAALEAFFPNGVSAQEFVAKLRGFEILHENESLAQCGVRDGSTILLARRRRQPVK